MSRYKIDVLTCDLFSPFSFNASWYFFAYLFKLSFIGHVSKIIFETEYATNLSRFSQVFIWSFVSICPYSKKEKHFPQKGLNQIPLVHLLLVERSSIQTINNSYLQQTSSLFFLMCIKNHINTIWLRGPFLRKNLY